MTSPPLPLLCRLFGHVHNPRHYGHVIPGPIDGLGIEHAELHMTCDHCQNLFPVGKFHRSDTARRAQFQAEEAHYAQHLANVAQERAKRERMASAAPAAFAALEALVRPYRDLDESTILCRYGDAIHARVVQGRAALALVQPKEPTT